MGYPPQNSSFDFFGHPTAHLALHVERTSNTNAANNVSLL